MELRSSESLILRCRANRTLGRRALGGYLYLPDQRLVFEPHQVDRLVGREGFLDVPLASVTAADVVSRSTGSLMGIRGRRLRVQCEDESEELFVVGRADALAAEVSRVTRAQ